MFSAVVLLVLTGLLLVAAAVVVRYVFLERANIMFVTGFAALVCMLCCLPVMAVLEEPSFPWGAHMMAFAALFVSGLSMAGSLYFLDDVYRFRGSGMMRQMAFLACAAPFLMGAAVFSEESSPSRFIGLLLILAALILPAVRTPENRQDTKQGQAARRAAAFGLCLGALAQCAFCLPSYMEQRELVSSSFRMFYFCAGALAAVIFLVIRRRELLDSRKCFVPSMLLAFVVMAVCGFLVFNGMDGLAACGRGLIAFPLITGSCFAGFYLFCNFVLKEKTYPVQSAGFILGIAGMIAVCL